MSEPDINRIETIRDDVIEELTTAIVRFAERLESDSTSSKVETIEFTIAVEWALAMVAAGSAKLNNEPRASFLGLCATVFDEAAERPNLLERVMSKLH